MPTSSQHHGWPIPNVDGDKDAWGGYLNNTLESLDSEVIVKDLFGNRPTAGTAGRWFLATDHGTLYYDTGNGWDTIIGKHMPSDDVRFQRVVSGAGSAANPAYTFLDPSGDTGMYRPADDRLAFSTGGTRAAEIQADGDFEFTGNLVDDADNIVYDQTAKYIPADRIQPGSLDAGTLDGNDSTYYLNHANLTGVGAGDHHNTIPISNGGTQLVGHPAAVNFASGITAASDGTGGVTVSVATGAPAATGTIQLAGGVGIVDTGVTTTGSLIDVSLDPSGGGQNAANVKVSARAFWDNGAGEYKVEILEDGTNIGNPFIGYEVRSS